MQNSCSVLSDFLCFGLAQHLIGYPFIPAFPASVKGRQYDRKQFSVRVAVVVLVKPLSSPRNVRNSLVLWRMPIRRLRLFYLLSWLLLFWELLAQMGQMTRISKMSLSSLSAMSKLHRTLSHPHFRGLCSTVKLLLG